MERKKTLTMSWDGLGEDDDDECFFESRERASSAVPLDLGSSSDEDDFEDSRMSFASNVNPLPAETLRKFSTKVPFNEATAEAAAAAPEYDMWMAAPGSITERRKRLLFGMGLDENKELLKVTSAVIGRAISKKFENNQNPSPSPASSPVPETTSDTTTTAAESEEAPKPECFPSPFRLVRSRSDGDIDTYSMPKFRKEELIGKISKQRLTRTTTEIVVPRARKCPYPDGSRAAAKDGRAVSKDDSAVGQSTQHGKKLSSVLSSSGVGAFFLIKNLDTGKEFIVNEYGENGTWNRLSDLQTGKKLTMEEFERTVGHSPVVKELMSREKVGRSSSDGCGYERKLTNNYFSKSLRMSKKTGAALLKNIKGVASGFIGEREREDTVKAPPPVVPEKRKNEWVRVRQSGKSRKELSALRLCQEFQAHEGCIWTTKFSADGHFLASAGEDKMIHVWEVQECEVMPLKPEEGNLTPIHPSLLPSAENQNGNGAEEKKKGKPGNNKGKIAEYVHVPETVFSLAEKPYLSFKGHSDDVLDLSWSKAQLLLLSSSMDKTVRLWDLETKACLKVFSHKDYVTCIQFNPIDDDYFISGSLDAKVRIWNIPDRQVVDWIDVHEMVTAISYTPDGQAALVGTHNGSCRMYSAEDCKLSHTSTIELRHKKKSNLRKVTGFQFSPGNPSSVLVTSADSRIRIIDGSDVVQKFQGFRNADSQIAASFSPDGRYIISASEDSQVFVWKHEERKHGSTGKGRNVHITRAHEQFPCKNVSIAIPWPCRVKGEPPIPSKESKRPSKRSSTPSSCTSPTKQDAGSKRNMLPPLPKKAQNNKDGKDNKDDNNNNNEATENGSASSPLEEDPAAISNSITESGNGESSGNQSKRVLPPLALKKDGAEGEAKAIEEDPEEAISRTESGIGDSFASYPSLIRYGDNSSSNLSQVFDDGNGATQTSHASAWGLVIVTAGFEGEIRCYQNFGLPRRI